MGYSIGVTEVVCFTAWCAEIGCSYPFETRYSREEAQIDADFHRHTHDERWRLQNEEWENA